MLSGFRTETCLYKFNVQMENIISKYFVDVSRAIVVHEYRYCMFIA